MTKVALDLPRPSQPEVRFIDTPEYRRLVYKWMRGEVRMPHPGGRISKWPALKAWKHSGEYVEALR
jgi:hypothetical protein